MVETMAAWSLTHGCAELLISGRMKPVQRLDLAAREAFFRDMFRPLLDRRTPHRPGP
jgi:hypothetical protein